MDEFLCLRRAKIEDWQKEKPYLIGTRCPNCGAFGHSFKWCPFAKEFRTDDVRRFRGPNGSWKCELPLELSLEERRKFEKHFMYLSMPPGAKSNEVILRSLQSDQPRAFIETRSGQGKDVDGCGRGAGRARRGV